MAFEMELCIRLTCDQCGRRQTDTEDRVQHWPSEATARADLQARGLPWRLGQDRQTCPMCLAVEACAGEGHDWGNWKSMYVLGEPALVIHFCRRCDINEVADAHVVGSA